MTSVSPVPITAPLGLTARRSLNRFSVPGGWLNGKVLRKKSFSRFQLKVLETALPVIRRIDRIWPWGGLSIIGVGVKE